MYCGVQQDSLDFTGSFGTVDDVRNTTHPENEVEEEDQPSEEAEACRHGHYSLCLFSGSLLRINEQFDCKPLAST